MSQMNFLLTTEKNYFKHSVTTIISIIENNLKYNLSFFVLVDESVEDYSLLEKVERLYNVKIHIISIEREKCIFLKDVYCKTPSFISAYYRLFIFKLDLGVDRILYIDSDIVCNADLLDLYNQDIGSCCVGAVPEFCFSYLNKLPLLNRRYEGYNKYLKNTFNYELETTKYINSGVLLIDFTKIDKNFTFQELIYLSKKNNKYFHDQTLINVYFKDKIFYLDWVYNVLTDLLDSSNTRFEYTIISDYSALLNTGTPKLIHYTPIKPWNNKNVFYYNLWEKYKNILTGIDNI